MRNPRRLLRKSIIALATCLLAGLPATASAQSAGRADAPSGARPLVGIALPLSGGYARIGGPLRDGIAASRLPDVADITMADTDCDDEAGRAAGREFVDAAVDLVIGFICVDARQEAFALPGLDAVTALVPLSSQIIETDPPAGVVRSGPAVVQLGPADGQDAQVLAEYLAQAWRSVPFALIDDGTLQGRDFVGRVRQHLADARMGPVFNDVFRPQLDNQVALVRRLERAGATHVVIGGDRADASVIAADAARIGVNLVLAGGDNFRGPDPESPLPDGTLYGGLPDFTNVDGARTLAAALDLPVRALLPFHVWGHAAGTVLAHIIETRPDITAPVPGTIIDTLLGPLTFDADGNLETNLMRVHEIVDRQAVIVETANEPT